MGVPKFYRWISERYPCLSEVIKEYQIPEFDNLYLDMNGIIHVCSHPNDDDPHFRISEEKIFADICHYLDFLFKMIKPREVFFMAVDGVAPRAKMNQQRGRRFRTAKDAEMLEQKARASGEVLPKEARFDSNCITPGTPFMVRLNEILKKFVEHKISTDKLWQNIAVYLSGHETPGEGEHKVMDFIRCQKSQPNYNPNTRHCLYGLDADLIMLGLCSHEPHFSLLREEVQFGRKNNQKRTISPEETTFHLLHLSLLREYLGHEFSPAKEKITFKFDVENIIDDFVLMSFLVGNDFIPHLPQLHIQHNALPILFKTYTDVLPDLGGYINEGGTLNLERFEMFFKKLAEYDYEKFGESSEFPRPGNKGSNEVKEDGFNKDKSKGLEKLANLGFSALSLSKTTEYDSSSEEDSDGGLFELEFSQHKRDYYRNKLQYESVTSGVLRDQAEGYVRAIQWNLHYYYNGIVSWSWYYPHHYAPYISDVKNFKDMKLEFDIGEPFAPFQQLLAVLPLLSKNLLPKPYQELMYGDDSPLKDFYPKDFDTDMNGKQQEWEAVVLIPFINEKLLLKCAKDADKRLTPEEKRRNRHGPHMLYTYTEKSSGSSESFLPGYFPPLEANHAQCKLLTPNTFRISAENLKKGLCPGVLLGEYFPGFPTLKHIEHVAKLSNEDVKVFQMVSQRDNMMLTIMQPVESDVEKVAQELLGKQIYINWPHLQEGLVISVSCDDKVYHLENSKIVSSVNEPAIFSIHWKSVKEHYYRRLGIYIGEPENPIVVHAKSLIGSKLVCSSNGTIKEVKEWSQSATNNALQTTVKDVKVHWPKNLSAKTFSEFYAIGSPVFIIGSQFYGSMGKIINNDLKKNSGKLNVLIDIYQEPNLQGIIRNRDTLSTQRYKPGHVMARTLGISSNFLARITGTFLVQTSSKESISPNTVNIGLNLKFNRRNEEVAGFSKKNEFNEWVYSEQVRNTLNSYMSEFPDFFDRILPHSKKDVVYVEDIYPEGNGNEEVSKVVKWLKAQQCSSAERQTCGLNTLDQGIVAALENVVCSTVSRHSECLEVLVKPEHLFNPAFCKGCVLPDPTATFEIFDRVISVKPNLAVPLGFRGTVIGIRTADRLCDYIYEVVFDKGFFGGLTLNCSPRKGYRMSPSALINLTYGKQLQPKSRNPVIPTASDAHFANRSSFSPPSQFITPKVTQLSSNGSAGKSYYKKPEIQTSSDSNFASMWDNLTTKQKESPPVSKPRAPETFGKPVSIEELFKAFENHKKPIHKPSVQSNNISTKAVLELMNHSTKLFGTPPTYTYQKLEMTGCYISTVTLPNGQTFVSAQCPSQMEASENAAEQALVLQQKFSKDESKILPKNDNQTKTNYVPRLPPPVLRGAPFMLPPPSFPIIPPTMRPIPFPIAPQTRVPTSFAPVDFPMVRYPNINGPYIPESFVEQNQMLLTGHIPMNQYMQPTNFIRPPQMNKLPQKNQNMNPGVTEFVPLQVLRNTTKKTSSEDVNVLLDNEWPALTPMQPSTVEQNVKVSTTNGVNPSTSENQTLFAEKAQPKTTQITRKSRIAAVFDKKI